MQTNTGSFGDHQFIVDAHELITRPDVRRSLRRDSKEFWIHCLQTGFIDGVGQDQRKVLRLMIELINSYALSVAVEKFKSNDIVSTYVDTLKRIKKGEDLQETMIEVISRLPQEFKDTLRDASRDAEEVLIEMIESI